ncbi:MAG: hypothetical protein ACR2LK_11525 [Solirubrobacteraceae bacterium]
MVNLVLRDAPTIGLERSAVEQCLLLDDEPRDVMFHIAWTSSLDALARRDRVGGLAGATGHIAESIVEMLLVDAGCQPVWHFTGPGRHGVDLLMLSPRSIACWRSRSRARCAPESSRGCRGAPCSR